MKEMNRTGLVILAKISLDNIDDIDIGDIDDDIGDIDDIDDDIDDDIAMILVILTIGDIDDDSEANHEVGPHFISKDYVTQRAATVAFANANIIHGQTVNEDILRTSMPSSFEDFQRGE